MGYSHVTWSCPYFGWDAKRVVKCEAGRIVFPDRAAEREFVHAHCANVTGWHQCNLAVYLTDYYDRLEAEEHAKRRQNQGPGD